MGSNHAAVASGQLRSSWSSEISGIMPCTSRHRDSRVGGSPHTPPKFSARHVRSCITSGEHPCWLQNRCISSALAPNWPWFSEEAPPAAVTRSSSTDTLLTSSGGGSLSSGSYSSGLLSFWAACRPLARRPQSGSLARRCSAAARDVGMRVQVRRTACNIGATAQGTSY